MSVSAADSPLLHSVRLYLEQRGMEVLPASAPFTFLGRYPNNPAASQGVCVVESIGELTPEWMEEIAGAGAASGFERVLLFANAFFPAGITQKAFQLCISLIDQSELQGLPDKTTRKSPPPLPVVHHNPVPVAGMPALPPPGYGPVVSAPVPPKRPKPKRSFIGQTCILIGAIWIGNASIRSVMRHAAEQRAKNGSVSAASEPTARLKSADASPAPVSVAKSAGARDFQKRYRLDEVRQVELRRLADDFVRKHEGLIPKVYLDTHRYALDQYFKELDQHPGLALLIIAELPDPSERQLLYDWVMPHLEAQGDPVLIFRAKHAKASLTKSLKDNNAALESYTRMTESFSGRDDYEFLVEDLAGVRGRYLFRNAPEGALTAVEASRHIPEWLKQLCRGEYHYHLAWGKQGAGTGNSVPASNREAYLAEMSLAEAAFLESWKLNPHQPHAATRMITVSDQVGRHPEDPLHWFEKALTAQLDHLPAYETYLNCLLASSKDPGAAVRQLEKICLHPHVARTDVPFFLIDVYASAGMRELNPAAYWKGLEAENQQEILALLEKKLATNDHPAHQRYYLSLKTALLYLFGDHHGSSQLYGKLGDKLDRGAYAKLPVSARDLELNGSIIKRPKSTAKSKPQA